MEITNSKEELKSYGVYFIVNKITNDVYVGSTIKNFSARISQHKTFYNRYREGFYERSVTPLLFEAFGKFGYENFKFVIAKSFNVDKNKDKRIKVIRYLEERFIENIKPKYNVCIKPTLSGCPNLGIKLTDDWKNNISKKSKLYKHSEETIKKVSDNNKNNSSLYKVYLKDGDVVEDSLINCSKILNITTWEIISVYKDKKYLSKTITKVEKLKKQSKNIKVFLENEEIVFNSYSDCDKFFKMWRGYTSTQINKNRNVILNYKYELINNDIVYYL